MHIFLIDSRLKILFLSSLSKLNLLLELDSEEIIPKIVLKFVSSVITGLTLFNSFKIFVLFIISTQNKINLFFPQIKTH